jgi:hypothetical protein
MKKSLGFILLAIMTTATAQAKQVHLSCNINYNDSQAAVSKALMKNPQARGATGDHGAILVSGLERFDLILSGDRIIGGEILSSDIQSKPIRVGQGGVPLKNLEDYSLSMTAQRGVLSIDLGGWDNYTYDIKVPTKSGKARASGTLDYDCGGEGSETLAVYDCIVE